MGTYKRNERFETRLTKVSKIKLESCFEVLKGSSLRKFSKAELFEMMIDEYSKFLAENKYPPALSAEQSLYFARDAIDKAIEKLEQEAYGD